MRPAGQGKRSPGRSGRDDGLNNVMTDVGEVAPVAKDVNEVVMVSCQMLLGRRPWPLLILWPILSRLCWGGVLGRLCRDGVPGRC